MTQNAAIENYSKVVSKAWTDHAFKAKLKSDPQVALRELGIDVPAGININVIEDAPNCVTLVLPAAPTEGELSVEDLEAVAGGTSTFAMGTLTACVCA